ncbi:hypothetical protein [Saccharothrix sp. S26]|nr:hypothetical protein [Saccharothrix sp. S26]
MTGPVVAGLPIELGSCGSGGAAAVAEDVAHQLPAVDGEVRSAV